MGWASRPPQEGCAFGQSLECQNAKGRGAPATQRGSVLVAVLAITALILVLVLGVLSQSRDSTRRSSIVADGLEAEALARLPAEIIATQIQRATTQGAAADGTGLLWASQPGLIRVFGTTVPAGSDRAKAEMHYRLYSAPVMNSAELDVAAEADALDGWEERPSAFTDLNEPVTSTRNGAPRKVFPIADPAALGHVEGFSERTPAPGKDEEDHPMPMPAAWIYVLKDGRLITPQPFAASVASFPRDVVTKANPIVGRIAFWTDDESCKLNLNTASEAAPWEMPRANTRTDRAFAAQPPQASEYHRFSGHPAFTSLSPVLAGLGGDNPGVQSVQPDPADPLVLEEPNKWLQYQNFYQSLVPHGVTMPWTAGTVAKQERHFTSVEEFGLDPQRKSNGAAAGFAITPDEVKRSRFFLTTHSASPELNPFGGPKIALWSLPKDTEQWSDEDRRISLCTALNTDPTSTQRREFAFQRAFDWAGTASPGSSQSTSDDWAYGPRNRELYAWLQSMSGRSFPGYGGRFVDKYGVMSRDEILTSMFDMMRWSANVPLPPAPGGDTLGKGEQSAQPLSVPGTTAAGTTLPGRGFGRFPTITEVAVVFVFTDVERNGNGQPRDDDGDGICDRATALRAFMVANPFIPAAGPPAVSPAWTLRYQRLMHWYVGPGITLGLPGGNIIDRCWLSSSLPISSGLAWGGHASAYAGFAAQFLQANGDPKLIGSREEPARDFPFISLTDVRLPTAEGRQGATLTFHAGRIIVDVMAPDAPAQSPKTGDSIQSIELEFPTTTELPIPSLRVQDFANGPRSLADRFKPVPVNGELRMPLIQKGDIVRSVALNPDGPSKGDARLLALRPALLFSDTPTTDSSDAAGWFIPHPDYASTTKLEVQTTKLEAQTLRDGAYMLTGQYGSTGAEGAVQPTPGGQMIPGVTYAANAVPAVPALQKGALQPPIGADPGLRLGDWESGGGLLEDGPFVNRGSAQPQGMLSRGRIVSDDVGGVREPLSVASSAVMFGAIPSGAYGGLLSAGDAAIDPYPRPWQTLLFCPNPAGRITEASKPGKYSSIARDHFGFASPPDHLWLEFFWMPVTAPWAMSKAFATEGKVNMNFQMLPYTWIHRATAMHGALKGVRVTAIPTKAMTAQGASAKGHNDGSPIDTSFRYEVDADKTLAAFEDRFDAGDVFRTASDICEMFLVPRRIEGHSYDVGGQPTPDPKDLKAGDMTPWWNGAEGVNDDAFEATGDNLREAPYAALHPRLCTQSNVFRVHYRVQFLRKSRTTKPEYWIESADHVAGERRGSYVLERQYAPGTTPVDDPAVSPGVSLNTMQKISIVEHVRFAP